MRVSVFKSQDPGRRAGALGGGLAPSPPARAIQARLCQSDWEFKKKFPHSKKAAEQNAANQKQQKEAEKFSDQLECLLDAYQCASAQIKGPTRT